MSPYPWLCFSAIFGCAALGSRTCSPWLRSRPACCPPYLITDTPAPLPCSNLAQGERKRDLGRLLTWSENEEFVPLIIADCQSPVQTFLDITAARSSHGRRFISINQKVACHVTKTVSPRAAKRLHNDNRLSRFPRSKYKKTGPCLFS